jgi:hypothetical protein
MDNSDDTINIIHKKPKQRNIAQTMETVDRRYLEWQCRYHVLVYTRILSCWSMPCIYMHLYVVWVSWAWRILCKVLRNYMQLSSTSSTFRLGDSVQTLREFDYDVLYAINNLIVHIYILQFNFHTYIFSIVATFMFMFFYKWPCN